VMIAKMLLFQKQIRVRLHAPKNPKLQQNHDVNRKIGKNGDPVRPHVAQTEIDPETDLVMDLVTTQTPMKQTNKPATVIRVIVVPVNQSVIVISPSATRTNDAKMFAQKNKLNPFANGPNGHLSAHAVTPVTKEPNDELDYVIVTEMSLKIYQSPAVKDQLSMKNHATTDHAHHHVNPDRGMIGDHVTANLTTQFKPEAANVTAVRRFATMFAPTRRKSVNQMHVNQLAARVPGVNGHRAMQFVAQEHELVTDLVSATTATKI
jgi:hypothetical protein